MSYDTYYDQRLLQLESLIYKSKSTDIYSRNERTHRLSVDEAKEIKKAYLKGDIVSKLDWHMFFMNTFINHKGFLNLTLEDYAKILTKAGYKTKSGSVINGTSVSVYITEIRSRYGLSKFRDKVSYKSYEDRIKEFSLSEWDFILNKVINQNFIVCVYMVYLYKWDIDRIDRLVGKNNFKSFLHRSVRILREKYKSEKNTKPKK